jgi:hypothetical protein
VGPLNKSTTLQSPRIAGRQWRGWINNHAIFFGIGTDCPEVTGNSGQAHTPEKLFQNIKWRNPNTKLWMRFAQSLITGHMRLPWKAFIV